MEDITLTENRIWKYRKIKGLKQEDLAFLIGQNNSSLNAVEKHLFQRKQMFYFFPREQSSRDLLKGVSSIARAHTAPG